MKLQAFISRYPIIWRHGPRCRRGARALILRTIFSDGNGTMKEMNPPKHLLFQNKIKILKKMSKLEGLKQKLAIFQNKFAKLSDELEESVKGIKD
jgi:hypothetical protein